MTRFAGRHYFLPPVQNRRRRMALHSPVTRNRRVAVVDDSEAVRQSLLLLLSARGFVVETFPGGTDLLAALETSDYACFVIDLKLDGMDGAALLEVIRARGLSQPAVLISGWDEAAIEGLANQAGFAAFVSKPMMKTSIVDLLDELLGGE